VKHSLSLFIYYFTDVRYCLQVEKNAQSALIGLYCRDVGQILKTTVGSHLNLLTERMVVSMLANWNTPPALSFLSMVKINSD
jgi:hypothetical protein